MPEPQPPADVAVDPPAKRRKRKPYLCLFRVMPGGRVSPQVLEGHRHIVRRAVERDTDGDRQRAIAMAGDQAHVVDRAVEVLRTGADTQFVAVMETHRDTLVAVRDELARAVSTPSAAADSATADPAPPADTDPPAPSPAPADKRVVVRLKQR